jgi:hypothetical protein
MYLDNNTHPLLQGLPTAREWLRVIAWALVLFGLIMLGIMLIAPYPPGGDLEALFSWGLGSAVQARDTGTFRCFCRPVWVADATWPDGYKPLAVPSDTCSTRHTATTRQEAIAWCEERNDKWRKHWQSVHLGTASPTAKRIYYTSNRYEWEKQA